MKPEVFPGLLGAFIYSIALNVSALPTTELPEPTNLAELKAKLSFQEKWESQKAGFTFKYPDHQESSFTCGLDYAYSSQDIDGAPVFDPKSFSFKRRGVIYPFFNIYNFPYYINKIPDSPEEKACTDPEKLSAGYEINKLDDKVLYGVIRVERGGSSGDTMAIPIKTDALRLVDSAGENGTITQVKYKFNITEDRDNIALHSTYNNSLEVTKWTGFVRDLNRARNLEGDERETLLMSSTYSLRLTASPKHSYKSYTGILNGRLRLSWPETPEKIIRTQYSSMADFKFGAPEYRKDFHYFDSVSFLIDGTYQIGGDIIDNMYRNRFRPVEIIIYPPKD